MSLIHKKYFPYNVTRWTALRTSWFIIYMYYTYIFRIFIIHYIFYPKRSTALRTSWWPSKRSSRRSTKSLSRPLPRCPDTRNVEQEMAKNFAVIMCNLISQKVNIEYWTNIYSTALFYSHKTWIWIIFVFFRQNKLNRHPKSLQLQNACWCCK